MRLALSRVGWRSRFSWIWLQGVAAWTSGFLGLVVLLGWHGSALPILKLGDAFPTAAYMAGWVLFLGGSALETARRGWSTTPSVLASLVLGIGAFSLVQTGLGFAWRPEAVLFGSATHGVVGPAILAPTTSLCSVAWGIAFLLTRTTWKGAPKTSGMLNLGVVVFTTVSLAAYATGLPSKANWGLAQAFFMALWPAIGLLTLALGLLAGHLASEQEKEGALGLPILIFSMGCGVTLVLTHALGIQRDHLLARRVQEDALSVQARIQSECEARLNDLAGMARRWRFRPPPESEWADDVDRYVSLHSGTVCLEWVGPEGIVQWVSPTQGHERWIGLSIDGLEAKKRLPYRLAEERGSPQVSASFPILEAREAGMVLVAPIHRQDSKGGHLVALVFVADWLERALSDARYQDYGIAIREGGKPLFQRALKAGAEGNFTWEVKLPGVSWDLNLVPGPAILSRHSNTLSRAFLLAGLLFSGMMAFLAHLARAARIRQEGFRASEARLRAVYEASPVGIVVLDQTGRHTQWNPAWPSFLGYSPTELASMTVMDLALPEERSGFEARLQAVFKGRVPSQAFEQGFVHKTGDLIWGSLATSARLEREGASPSILLVVQDITTRRQAEATLRRTQTNLEAAQRLANIGSWDWDVASGSLAWSAEQFRIFGEDPATFVPTYEAYLGHLEESERIHTHAAVQSALSARGDYALEHPIRRPDGIVRMVFEQGQVDFDASGRPSRMFGTTQDITERKKLERLREDFVSVVSHELRTPLTSIRGSLGLLEACFGAQLGDQAQELLRISTRNCDRLVVLISDLLDIQKVESGTMAFQFQKENLCSLVEEAIRATEGFAAGHGTGFRASLPSEPLWVRGDRHRLIQVVTNLLSNAAKFGGTAQWVDVRLGTQDGWVRLEVEDHGTGIPEGFHDRIFQKFAQADEGTTRATGGTGLGLSIVKAILDHHGGRIHFVTQPGSGTTFIVELPPWDPTDGESPR